MPKNCDVHDTKFGATSIGGELDAVDNSGEYKMDNN
jgi:hypothetical protein